MNTDNKERREGSLDSPIRHPIKWQEPEFYNSDSLFAELERVFNICHGCRRCVSLCHAFPTLFDLIDESETMEIDGVDKEDFWQVVDHCYLCDLCYMTKCPYVPPHEWNVDFPHLMLRGKANKFEQGRSKWRDRVLSSTDTIGRIAGIPVVAQTVNSLNNTGLARKMLDSTIGIHAEARLPGYHSNTARKRFRRKQATELTAETTDTTSGKVAVFITCYGNRNEPSMLEEMVRVFEHNNIPVRLTEKERCCGMPKLELGDLKSVEKAKNFNIPQLLKLIDEGWDIVAPIPSCVLMFKQEIPLMFPDDKDVKKVQDAVFDPFEYLHLRHKAGKLNTDFKNPLGKIAYHAPCHQRVQNIGLKTRDVLALIPETDIEVIDRCSGHDGTYAVRSESHEISMKICKPVANRVRKAEPKRLISDCPMAATQIAGAMENGLQAESPFSLLCEAYGIN